MHIFKIQEVTEEINNYRPISLLQEETVSERLLHYMDTKLHLQPLQSSLRCNHSTVRQWYAIRKCQTASWWKEIE